MQEHKDPAMYDEKHVSNKQYDPEDGTSLVGSQNTLHRELKGRHMQMIAM